MRFHTIKKGAGILLSKTNDNNESETVDLNTFRPSHLNIIGKMESLKKSPFDNISELSQQNLGNNSVNDYGFLNEIPLGKSKSKKSSYTAKAGNKLNRKEVREIPDFNNIFYISGFLCDRKVKR